MRWGAQSCTDMVLIGACRTCMHLLLVGRYPCAHHHPGKGLAANEGTSGMLTCLEVGWQGLHLCSPGSLGQRLDSRHLLKAARRPCFFPVTAHTETQSYLGASTVQVSPAAGSPTGHTVAAMSDPVARCARNIQWIISNSFHTRGECCD